MREGICLYNWLLKGFTGCNVIHDYGWYPHANLVNDYSRNQHPPMTNIMLNWPLQKLII